MSTHYSLQEFKVSATDISTEILALVLEKVTSVLKINQPLLVRLLKLLRLICTDARPHESRSRSLPVSERAHSCRFCLVARAFALSVPDSFVGCAVPTTASTQASRYLLAPSRARPLIQHPHERSWLQVLNPVVSSLSTCGCCKRLLFLGRGTPAWVHSRQAQLSLLLPAAPFIITELGGAMMRIRHLGWTLPHGDAALD